MVLCRIGRRVVEYAINGKTKFLELCSRILVSREHQQIVPMSGWQQGYLGSL